MALIGRRNFLTQAALGPLVAAQITSLPLFGSMCALTSDLAFVFPGAHGLKQGGVLQPQEKQHVVDQISGTLKKEYGYESVDLSVASTPSFWYPFHQDAVVCCRLSVRT